MSVAWNVERIGKLAAIVGALVTFVWGVYQYFDARTRDADIRRLEAIEPFLDRQLKLYTEATQVTAAIATTTDPVERAKATSRFWALYYGELALVEDRYVEAAMVAFGRALSKSAKTEELQQLSLQLAHECRESLARAWGVSAWRDPHEVAREKRDKLIVGE